MGDWDLQAVVRGCSTSSVASTSSPTQLSRTGGGGGGGFLSTYRIDMPEIVHQDLQLPLLLQDDDFNGAGGAAAAFPDLLASVPIMELDQLWKPFCPNIKSSDVGAATHTTSTSQHHHHQQANSHPVRSNAAAASRSKRRKNQVKRVVCQVPAEGLSSDIWAWRKYGQKPIKGSPYPRGYYRCSSSKGCMARKQVERSRTDPGTFIITFTAEHNHPAPTHRNSLAGSTRNKYQVSDHVLPAAAATSPKEPAASTSNGGESANCSPAGSGSSPRTPFTAAMDDAHEIELEMDEMEEANMAGPLGERDDFLDLMDDVFAIPSTAPTTEVMEERFPTGFHSWPESTTSAAATAGTE